MRKSIRALTTKGTKYHEGKPRAVNQDQVSFVEALNVFFLRFELFGLKTRIVCNIIYIIPAGTAQCFTVKKDGLIWIISRMSPSFLVCEVK